MLYSKKYDDILAEATLGFSRGLSIAVPRIKYEDDAVKGLTKITHIPSSRLEKSDDYLDQTAEVRDKKIKPPARLFRVGKYLVRVAVMPATQEVFSSCECMDFIMRMRRQEAACKHIAAALRLHYPQVVKILQRRC